MKYLRKIPNAEKERTFRCVFIAPQKESSYGERIRQILQKREYSNDKEHVTIENTRLPFTPLGAFWSVFNRDAQLGQTISDTVGDVKLAGRAKLSSDIH